MTKRATNLAKIRWDGPDSLRFWQEVGPVMTAAVMVILVVTLAVAAFAYGGDNTVPDSQLNTLAPQPPSDIIKQATPAVRADFKRAYATAALVCSSDLFYGRVCMDLRLADFGAGNRRALGVAGIRDFYQTELRQRRNRLYKDHFLSDQLRQR